MADTRITAEQLARWKFIEDRWQAVCDYESVPTDSPSALARFRAFTDMAAEAFPALVAEIERLRVGVDRVRSRVQLRAMDESEAGREDAAGALAKVADELRRLTQR